MAAPTITEGSTVKVIGHGSTKQASAKLVGMTGSVLSVSAKGNAKVDFEGTARVIGLDDLVAVRTILAGPSKTEVFDAIRAVRQALRTVEQSYQVNNYEADTSELFGSVEALTALAKDKVEASLASA